MGSRIVYNIIMIYMYTMILCILLISKKKSVQRTKRTFARVYLYVDIYIMMRLTQPRIKHIIVITTDVITIISSAPSVRYLRS